MNDFRISVSIADPDEYGESDLVANVVIDGEVVKEYVDTTKLAYSLYFNWMTLYDGRYINEFFPFTCSCGVSGCAGIYQGIHIKKRKRTVEWRVPQTKSCLAGDTSPQYSLKRFYSFGREQYEFECERLQSILLEEYGFDGLHSELEWFEDVLGCRRLW